MKNKFKKQRGPAPTPNVGVAWRSQVGFTMVELLIYISLTVVVITLFTVFISDVLRSQKRLVSAQAVQQESRFVLMRINQEIKTAREILNVQPQSLTLRNPAGQTVTIYLSTIDNLIYRSEGVINSPLSSADIDITHLNFSTDNDLIYTELTAEKITPGSVGGKYTATSSSIVMPREKIY